MVLIVMGVSGCGKSTVAEALAQRINGDFFDADAFHPQANIDKMSQGIALTDQDRVGWLDRLAQLVANQSRGPRHTVLACSALKEAYRNRLRVIPSVRFVYLQGRFETVEARLNQRKGHFMKADLLRSQWNTLEEPPSGPGTDTFSVDMDLRVDSIVDRVLATLSEDWFGNPSFDPNSSTDLGEARSEQTTRR